MDAERWPGGGCEGYMRRLVTEIMPLVGATFGTASDPARVAFGGGSFAGWVCAMLGPWMPRVQHTGVCWGPLPPHCHLQRHTLLTPLVH